MTPEISIIIPVYNCEKFLPECLKSAAEQSFQNIEVLCVDNASTDSSPKIIKDFAAKHSNFFYFYKKGGMAAGARNEGLKHAKGKYILFLDSDDILKQKACEIIYKKAEEENADIVTASFSAIDEKGRKLSDYNAKDMPLKLVRPPATRAQLLYIGAGLIGRPWGTLIRTNIIAENNLRFPEGCNAEDVPFMGALFALSAKFVFLNEPLILFRHTNNSLGSKYRDISALVNFKNYNQIRDFLKRTNIYTEVEDELEYILLKQIIGGECIGNGSLKQLNKSSVKEFFELCKPFYLNLPTDFFKDRNIIFKMKFNLFKFSLRHNLYYLPRLARVIINPIIFFYGIFFTLKESSLRGLP